MCRVGGHACNHVCADGGAHGGYLFVDERGVVAVDNQDGHDPEDEDSLEEVVVIETVHEFTEVGPDVPRGGEYKLCFLVLASVCIDA